MGRFVRDWLLDAASARPQDEAIVDAQQRWTYADLEAATRRVASSLRAAGAGVGSRVAVLLGDGAAAVAAVHAVRCIGAVLVPLNRRAAAAELAFQIGVAEVAVLVHDTGNATLARGALTGHATITPLEIARLLAPSARPVSRAVLHEEVDLDAPATVLFTSGTTDRPKGAILTHGAHVASADAWAAFLEPRPSDRWLACVPLFHVAGLAIVTRASRWGVPLVVQPRFDPGAVCGALERGVSHVSLVAPMLDQLLASGACAVPRTLRAVLVGGGPVLADQVLRARRRGWPVVPTYGLTETASGVAALPADAVADHAATVGRALPGVQLRIAVDGRPMRAGQAGEILVRGPMTFAGYTGLPDETARALRDGWLHTGDFGVLDEDGYLTVIDRRDDLIVSGGENISPSEVESALLAYPAVAEAAVVGRPDARWGSVPVAVIVLRHGGEVTDRMLADHCRDRLAGFKVPVAFQRRASLPRAPNGKLLRSVIREMLGEASA